MGAPSSMKPIQVCLLPPSGSMLSGSAPWKPLHGLPRWTAPAHPVSQVRSWVVMPRPGLCGLAAWMLRFVLQKGQVWHRGGLGCTLLLRSV